MTARRAALTAGQSLQRRQLLVAALALATPAASSAAPVAPAEVRALLPDARLQGSGRMRYDGLHICDARLWVGARFDPARPADMLLALELEYARPFAGGQIAERSLEEMRRLGELAPVEAAGWLAAMRQNFPDVNAGQRITGIQQPGTGATFFLDGRASGEIRDPAFARRFFAIWLSPHSSEPRLRRELLGAG